MSGIWKSGTYRVARAMRMAGNRPGVIAAWKREVEEWAQRQPPSPEVNGLLAWLPLWQERDVYTAAELAPMLPALAAYLGYKELGHPRSVQRVENRLRFVGLPTLVNADGQDSFVNPATGRYDRYFICARIPFWLQRRLTQEEFEREFFQ